MLLPLIVVIYIVFHIPAIVMLIIGLAKLKKKPETAKVLLILAGIYFVIGGGICASILYH